MEKDTVWKSYLSDNERFADLINGILFCGRQIVKADSIEELDTQTGYVKHPGTCRYRMRGVCGLFHAAAGYEL